MDWEKRTEESAFSGNWRAAEKKQQVEASIPVMKQIAIKEAGDAAIKINSEISAQLGNFSKTIEDAHSSSKVSHESLRECKRVWTILMTRLFNRSRE